VNSVEIARYSPWKPGQSLMLVTRKNSTVVRLGHASICDGFLAKDEFVNTELFGHPDHLDPMPF
jgi:hypothetical protein